MGKIKKDIGIISEVEEKIGEAWKAFCLREWEKSGPEFDRRLFDRRFVEELLYELVRKLTDEGIIYFDFGDYIKKHGYKKGYVLYIHYIVVNDKIVGRIYEEYHDDGTYILDVEEA